MRLPFTGKADIDEEKSIGIIRYAIDHGINYLDLGYPYNVKQHERLTGVFGKALGDGYRKKVKITANLPLFNVNSTEDCNRLLNEQLRLLQTDKVDFYLIGILDRNTWPRLQEMNILNWAEKTIADNRLGYIGFFLHDYFQTLRSVIESYDNWTLCQFQCSYMDADHHPGVTGIKYAADNGLAVVITEPLKYGRLVKNPPEPIARIWESTQQTRSSPEWGLRWVWNMAEVSTVVSDMSSIEQVKENIATAENAIPDNLSILDQVVIAKVRDAYRNKRPIWCDACRGCMPCPQNIDVPRIFEIYNDAIMYDDVETAKFLYSAEQHHIEDCIECGNCMKTCGRKINILEFLKEAQQLLA